MFLEIYGALALEDRRKRKIQEIAWYGVTTEEKRKTGMWCPDSQRKIQKVMAKHMQYC